MYELQQLFQLIRYANHYLLLAMKGDTFLCSLGDGHLGVHASIIRNAHLTKLYQNFE